MSLPISIRIGAGVSSLDRRAIYRQFESLVTSCYLCNYRVFNHLHFPFRPACHARGREFESRRSRHKLPRTSVRGVLFLITESGDLSHRGSSPVRYATSGNPQHRRINNGVAPVARGQSSIFSSQYRPESASIPVFPGWYGFPSESRGTLHSLTFPVLLW